MPPKSFPLFALLCLLTFSSAIGVAGPAAAEPKADAPPASAASTLTPGQAKAALDTLQNDDKRKAMIDTLQAIASATPPEKKTAIPIDANGLGAQLLLTISEQLGEAARDVVSAAQSVTQFPALWYWLQTAANDPATYRLLFDIAWKLVVVFGGALSVEWLTVWLLRRPKAALDARIPYVARASAVVLDRIDPPSSTADLADVPDLHRRHRSLTRAWQSLVRLPFALGRLLLELLPVLVFVGGVSLLLDTQIGDAGVTRLAILAIVNAYVVARIIISVQRALFGPLALFTVREETAAYMDIWIRRIVTVGAAGIAVANIALLLGLYRSGYAALIRLVMLVVHLFLVVVILQCHRPIADALRAPLNASGIMSVLRNRLASVWHVLAIAIVMAMWGVWAFNVQNGITLVLQYFVGTVAVILATRLVQMLALSLIDRGFRIKPEILHRFPVWRPAPIATCRCCAASRPARSRSRALSRCSRSGASMPSCGSMAARSAAASSLRWRPSASLRCRRRRSGKAPTR